MKQLLFIALLLPLSLTVNAQKLGYINSLELINMMPEALEADSLLKVYAKEIQVQYDSYVLEYQNKSKEYDAIKDSASELVLEAKVSDLQSLEERIKSFESESNVKLAEKREQMFQPILKKATDLVKQVAEENGYKMIFDTSSGAIAYAPDGDNIIKLLAKKLGVE